MDPDKNNPQTEADESKVTETAPEPPVEVVAAPPVEEPSSDGIPQLGDVIQFDDGKWAGRRGTILYCDVNRILILPVGGSSKLDSIPMVRRDESGETQKVAEGEAPEEGATYEIDPDLEVNHITLSKHPLNKFVYDEESKEFFLQTAPFVVVTNLKPGQIVTTYTKEGAFGPKFSVEEVNEEEDFAVFVQKEEGEESNPYKLEFDYRGIPLNEPFQYFTAAFPPTTTAAPTQEASPGKEATVVEEEEGLDDLGDEFEFLDETEEVYQAAVEVKAGKAKSIEYTDAEQKSGMLTDLMKDSKLSDKQRLHPRRIKKVKVLTEQLFSLRNDFVNYLPAGKGIEGTKKTSFATVTDILEESKIPLARPIVNSKRALYYDHTPKYYEEEKTKGLGDVGSVDPITSDRNDISINFLDETIKGSIDYLKKNMTSSMNPPPTEETSALPKFYSEFQNYFSLYFPQFPLIDEANASAPIDMDVFRGDIPKTDKEIKTVGGLQRLSANRDAIVDSSISQTVAFSRLRSITSRSSRLSSNELVTVENSDVLNVISYLFFPFLYLREFGATRTGDLALDIAQSMLPSKTIKMILEKNGPIREKEEGEEEAFNPDKILPLKKDGSVLSNLSIADWLSGQPIYGRGIGDLLPLLTSLGLRNKDLNEEQMKIIVEKINQYNLALRTFLNNERTKAEETAQKTTVQVDTLLNVQAIEALFKQIWSQKAEGLLPSALLQFAERVPAYKESDIARFAFLYKKYPDLFQDTLAGKPTHEYIRAARTILLTKKKNELLVERMKKEKVGPPKPNPCEHVAQYNIIKNAKNQGERMELLAKFISTYRTEEKENHWLMCRVCNKHLLCEHEFLQIREFMDPLRAKQYHKELLLTFNDGIFMGQYICKNCGQGIQEIEYDTHMEFNDKGVPMIGRGTIEDKDQEIKDEIERLLDTKPAEAPMQITFENPFEKIVYPVMKRILGAIGVAFTKETYQRLVKQAAGFLGLKTVADFNEAEKKRAEKIKGYKKTTYPEYSSRVIIGTTAAAILVEIQTHVPEYTIEYAVENCVASFEGYPLDPTRTVADGKDIIKDDRVLKYMTCALATIRDDKEPWNKTGFQSITEDTKRQVQIGQSLYNNVKAYCEKAIVQQELETKRKYLTEKFGRAPGGMFAEEKIPDGFVPYFMKVNKGDAAKAPLQELAARGSSRVSGWLMAAHAIAREGTKLSGTSKKILYTCCYDKVSSPMNYWIQKKIPELGPKEVPIGNRGSYLRIPMTLRDERPLLGSVDPANMMKLFAKICFRGPRVGYPHEPGYDMKCPHCGLTFLYDPRDPIMPLITDELRSKKYSYSKLVEKGMEEAEKDLLAKKEQSLSNAGVTVNAKEFDELLDTMHDHYRVPKVVVKPITTIQIKLLEDLRDIAYAPFNDYKQILNQTIENIRDVQTRKPATKSDITRAYEPIILKVNDFETELKGYLGQTPYNVFVQMFKGLENGDSCSRLAQTLLSTFLLPFQRSITKYSKENLVNPPASLKLTGKIVEDIQKLLNAHIVESLYFEPQYTSTKKLRDAVNKLKVMIPFLQKNIRLNTFPGQISEYPYLPRFLILGIFIELLDPDVLPSDYDSTDSFGLVQKDKDAPKEFILKLLEKKKEENLDFTDESIRTVIEQRNEEERQEVLGRFKKLPDSLKALESQKKKLRIGDWAVGGSKAIYTYDEDQYARERAQREQANQGEDEITDDAVEEGEVITEEEANEIDAGYDVIDTEDHEDGRDAELDAGGVSC